MRGTVGVLWLALAGCVSYAEVDRRPLLTVEDVVRMNEAGVDEKTLLARVRSSRLSAPVTADEVIRLKNEKVPDPVIQALASAAPERVRVVERPYYVGPSIGFYGYYPYGYYGSWPYSYYYRPYYRYYPYSYGYHGGYYGHGRYYHSPRRYR